MRKLAWPLAILLLLGGAVAYGVQRGGSDDEQAELPPAFVPETAPPTSVPRTTTQPPARETAAEVFGHTCGTCHTMRAAGTTSFIGPDLDRAGPTLERVLRFVRNGSSDGTMPAELLRGREAQRVAEYVARVAGSG